MTTVLLDGFVLADSSQLRGIGTHLKRILSGLAARPELSIKVLADPTVALPEGVEPIPFHQHVPLRLRDLEHELRLPFEIKRHDCDVFHSPAQHPPRRSSVPWLQTLHDLIPLTRPHPLLARDRRRWIRLAPRLRQAAAIVAVSRFSADEGIRHLGLDSRRVHVIPNGVDTAVFHPGEANTGDPSYLLHVAAWGPHKGFTEALAVMARLAARGLPHRLVMAGPQDDWMLAQIRRAVASSPCPQRVSIAGYVDDLPSLYRGAAALLMTSRCEGFGLPALEAMACATPVVAFANSSLPEIIGDGGLLVPDGDIDAMATAVQQLVSDERARTELAARSVARAARFRWEDSVDAYADLLRSVAG